MSVSSSKGLTSSANSLLSLRSDVSKVRKDFNVTSVRTGETETPLMSREALQDGPLFNYAPHWPARALTANEFFYVEREANPLLQSCLLMADQWVGDSTHGTSLDYFDGDKYLMGLECPPGCTVGTSHLYESVKKHDRFALGELVLASRIVTDIDEREEILSFNTIFIAEFDKDKLWMLPTQLGGDSCLVFVEGETDYSALLAWLNAKDHVLCIQGEKLTEFEHSLRKLLDSEEDPYRQ